MFLYTVASGSSGNTYILYNDDVALIIEAGVSFKTVKQSPPINFNLSKIVGVIVGHAHRDHAGYMKDYEKAGIPVLAPWKSYREKLAVGGFYVQSFRLVHDVDCYGFYIRHPDIGVMIYASDTEYIKYTFKEINHFLVEANHDIDKVDVDVIRNNRTIQTHLSLQTCMDFLKVNHSPAVRNIVLCHLSETNIDKDIALERVTDTFPNVHCSIAEPGSEICIDEYPF